MGIQLGSNFDFQAALPLDSRTVVADLTARDAILDGIRYEGLTVFVEADGINYQLIGGTTDSDWVAVGGAVAPTGYVYIIGDATTDGSWRYKALALGDDLELEKRKAGVWTLVSRNNF
jgi:hypothetical protein